jgi:hypothetical protein
MDYTFVRGIDTRETIERDIRNLFDQRGYMPMDIPVMRVMEGYDLDLRARTFENAFEVAKIIADCFRDTDVFKRAFIWLDEELEVMYMMFTQSEDAALPEFLTMAVAGNA